MKQAAAALALLAAVAAVPPAHAAVLEVSTSVAVEDADDQAALRTALQSAVDDLLKDATGFAPTLMVLTRAVVVGGRLHVRMLLADRAGEQELMGAGSVAPASIPLSSPADI